MMSEGSSKPVRVFLVCTGVGIFDRGIETFARECFDGIRDTPGLDLTLLKGRGPDVIPAERRVWCLPRTGALARNIGRLIGRNGYVVEQLSSFFPVVRELRRERPDIVFTSDGNLARWLFVFRRRIGVPFRLVFSNGGPNGPRFPFVDHVQQVTPYYREEALAAGEPPEKHSLVPYGIRVPPGDPELLSGEAKAALRHRLGIPADGRPVVVSVGAITTSDHKRVGYTIGEVAALPATPRRPFLVLLGAQNETTATLIQRAQEQLGADGFVARSVPYPEVADYYRAADAFVLGSLTEGFGRVYLEALIAGLPVVLHDGPVMRYVAGEEGAYGDLSLPGSGTQLLTRVLNQSNRPEDASRRRRMVRERFGWETLRSQYLEMFRTSLAARLPGV